MRSNIFLFVFLLLGVVSCQDDNATCSILSQNLKGNIYGNSWTAGQGRATHTTVDGKTMFDVVIFTSGMTISDLCGVNDEGLKRVLFSIPDEIGNRPLRLDLEDLDGSQTITLFDPASTLGNDLATDGCAEIISITSTEVIMAIKATTPNSEINGNITLSRCN